ncbi:MAG: PSP1 domain-containing protein [Bacteroidia bacterium]
MSCSGCSTGRGNHNVPEGVPAGCQSNGACGTGGGCNKLNVFDWLTDMKLPAGEKPFDVVEVRFKNSRKEFFKNQSGTTLQTGDVVAVEASPGHDMGVVSLTGELVRIQMKKHGVGYDSPEIKKVYRKAKASDIEKWREAQALETQAMYKARTLAIKHGLAMKISDVEYQGDKTKAVFYYTADARVDFRELIKTMAYEFSVRIEMRQIGARQEAARLGGIGSCGRELCCSTWLTDFRTVNTSAARYQQLSLNPLKLAGQCGKLKCCLNYELDSYLDAVKDFPNVDNVKLVSKKGRAFHQKTDIFKRMMWFSYEGEASIFIPLPVSRVKQIIEMNKNNIQPDELAEEVKTETKPAHKPIDFKNVDNQDSLSRFDKKKNPNRNQNQRKGQGGGQNNRRPNPNQKQGQQGNKPNPNNKQGGNRNNNNNRRPNNNKPNNNKPNNNDKKN